MKLLFHFMLLIICISTTNSTSYSDNKLRENFVQFLKHQNSVAQKTPVKSNFANVHRNYFRNGDEYEDWGKIFDEASNPDIGPILKYGLVADEVKESTPKFLRMQKKRKKTEPNSNDAAYIVQENKDAQQLRMSNNNYQNEEDEQRKRDIELAKSKAKVLRNSQQYENRLNSVDAPYSRNAKLYKQMYQMDPVLNLLRSHYRRKRLGARRDGMVSSSEESSVGSSADEEQWKEEWRHYWGMKKFEALNSTMPSGDTVNMAAARPWGVQCGDPNQHDMPWGQCMLSVECEPEFRIYRGDFFCGRTEFICCALMLTNYDLYQGIDVSFDDRSLSTDSEEKNRAGKSSEKAKRKKRREKEKRKKDRIKRKNKIKKNIRKIIKAITKILDNQYRNGTKQRKRKTSMLKKFVKHLKKQYKKDRTAVKELHEEQMMKIDAALQEKLNQIKMVNEEFMKNETFRDIVVNGKMNKTGARMLVQAYPELLPYFEQTRRQEELLARSDVSSDKPQESYDKSEELRAKSSNDDYDVEYGYLYE